VEWFESMIMLLTYVLYCIFMRFNTRIAASVVLQLGLVGDDEVAQVQKKSDDPELAPVSPTGIDTEARAADILAKELASDDTLRAAGKGDLDSPQSLDDIPKDASLAAQVIGFSDEDLGMTGSSSRERKKEKRKNAVALLQTHDPLALCWAACMPLPELQTLQVFGICVCCIFLLAYLLVDAATRASIVLNISPMLMGLLLVAPGTSSLAVVSAIDDVKDGEADVALANILGSSLFDMLVSLALPWFFHGWSRPVEFKTSIQPLTTGNLVMLFIALVGFLVMLQVQKWSVVWQTSYLLLGCYGVWFLGNFIAMCEGSGL